MFIFICSLCLVFIICEAWTWEKFYSLPLDFPHFSTHGVKRGGMLMLNNERHGSERFLSILLADVAEEKLIRENCPLTQQDYNVFVSLTITFLSRYEWRIRLAHEARVRLAGWNSIELMPQLQDVNRLRKIQYFPPSPTRVARISCFLPYNCITCRDVIHS